MSFEVYDDTACMLGEGPLWHPGRGQLFWFDILGHRLLTREGDETQSWDFGECVSAAGWVDHDRLIVASETCLSLFDITNGETEFLCPLEADRADTRSNDGRADPMGGFWIGTMGKVAEPGAGAFYRYHRGQLRRIIPDLTIPNSCCFASDGRTAYFSDTAEGVIRRIALDDEGWPTGRSEAFIAGMGNPDGAVTDAQGNLWCARWGDWRVTCHGPDGTLARAFEVGGAHASCPAFGGPGLRDLFVTTALEDLSPTDAARSPDNGKVFVIRDAGQGRPEPRVLL